ncbi:MAG: futalosine hydrolase [Actinomycetes bacterium]
MTLLVVTAVQQERDAVIRDLGPESLSFAPYDEWGGVVIETPAGDAHVVHGGVGPVAAAAITATALSLWDYDLVLSAGLAGGFRGRAEVGDVVVASASIAADLGCRTDEGVLSLKDMGLGQDSGVAFGDAWRWQQRLADHAVPSVLGEVLTMSCMTGTDAEGDDLARRYPQAVAEAMEGWGVVWPAYLHRDVKVGEIRAVSNIVGKRNVSGWDIDAAFDALARAFGALLSEPLP